MASLHYQEPPRDIAPERVSTNSSGTSLKDTGPMLTMLALLECRASCCNTLTREPVRSSALPRMINKNWIKNPTLDLCTACSIVRTRTFTLLECSLTHANILGPT